MRVESHFLKLPSRATEAFTKNLIVLVSGLISKTGTPCARDTEGSTADANKLRTIHCIRMAVSVRFYYFVVKHRDVDANDFPQSPGHFLSIETDFFNSHRDYHHLSTLI